MYWQVSLLVFDATAINRLKEICLQLKAKGTAIIISGANHNVKMELLTANMYAILDRHNIQDNINTAISRALQIMETKK